MSPRFRFGNGAGLASSTPISWTLAGSCATRPLLIAASSLRVLAGACATSVAHTDLTFPPRLRLTLCEPLSTLGRFAPSAAGRPANLSAGCGVHLQERTDMFRKKPASVPRRSTFRRRTCGLSWRLASTYRLRRSCAS